jgi:hypothetical protein
MGQLAGVVHAPAQASERDSVFAGHRAVGFSLRSSASSLSGEQPHVTAAYFLEVVSSHGSCNTTNEEWGLLPGQNWGLRTGHQWGLFMATDR